MKQKVQSPTELTQTAMKFKEGEGIFDTLLMDWSNKVNLNRVANENTVNNEDSKDLKQEILTNLFEKFDEFTPEKANFETWAYWKMKATIRSYVRKEIIRNNPVHNSGKGKEAVRFKLVSMDGLSEHDSKFDIPCPKKKKMDMLNDVIKVIEDSINKSNTDRRNKVAMKFMVRKLADEKKPNEIIKSLKFWKLILDHERPKEKYYRNIRKIRKTIQECA